MQDFERIETRKGNRTIIVYRPKRPASNLASYPAPHVLSSMRMFHGSEDDGFGTDNHHRMKARAIARANGVNPEGKKYFPMLAEKPLDPNAWMSDDTDIRRRCEEKGWSCDGAVQVKGPTIDTPDAKPYQVAPDIVQKRIDEIELDEGVKLTGRERMDIQENLTTKLSGTQD
jgi:hypothetical protein